MSGRNEAKQAATAGVSTPFAATPPLPPSAAGTSPVSTVMSETPHSDTPVTPSPRGSSAFSTTGSGGLAQLRASAAKHAQKPSP